MMILPRALASTLALAVLSGSCAPGPAGERPSPSGDLLMVASLDLTTVTPDQDRVSVEIDPGPLTDDTVLFRLPRVVQGTYDVSDFGRMVDDLRAYDVSGAEMPVESLDVDTWRIVDATRLDRLTYRVNDTYDQEYSFDDMPFSPSGTNIDPDAFVLNLHGFVGYFEGQGEADYEIRITAPRSLRASSALPMVDSTAAGGTITRVYRADRYFEVTDNPLFYGEITVASVRVPDVEVVLSVYSPTGRYDAAGLAPALERGMRAQRAYLGDLLQTDRYDIFLFLAGAGNDQPRGAGALEHHRSTIMTYPESTPPDELERGVIDVVSHEFFHTVSPLAVHSEDIQYFDYHDPTFSKHLWMYEGQTEYFAQHFQVYEGLLSREEFLERMSGKVVLAGGFDDTMSFTAMSENILDDPYAANYGNVYQKGALIGMCLDVLLRSSSDGERGLIDLMGELSERYGVDRPFDDDSIIGEITALTYPEVGAFLRRHVVGTTPIDYGDCVADAGVELGAETVPAASLFAPDVLRPAIQYDEATGEITFTTVVDPLWNLGVRVGDVLTAVNGTVYTPENIGELMYASAAWTPETELTIAVKRGGRELEFSGVRGDLTWQRPQFRFDPDATPRELRIREAWLGGA